MSNLKITVKALATGLAMAVLATGCATAKTGKAASAAPSAAPAVASAAGDSYTVKKGDCLWCISGLSEIYSNPFHWPVIFKANSDQIKDADLIYPDQKLSIPRDASASAIDAAVRLAKSRGQWVLGVNDDARAKDEAYLAQ